ncbi:hypothetical protein NPIL_183281 [Nephila pilipes]|uniref:Uncharacterized protein n=1 Tax=Nephila pilipes TaxID=299642 RepID=A0A8X6TBV8_NEPPI|nr:hypothetical protein NPIL_183281 [Nephila pilipes]
MDYIFGYNSTLYPVPIHKPHQIPSASAQAPLVQTPTEEKQSKISKIQSQSLRCTNDICSESFCLPNTGGHKALSPEMNPTSQRPNLLIPLKPGRQPSFTKAPPE